MANEMILSRRHVLKRGAALVVGFYLPEKVRGLAGVSNDMATFKPNAWVRIARDNGITILSEVPEMGQGTRTAGVMMLADELYRWSGRAFSASRLRQYRKRTSTSRQEEAEARKRRGFRCAERALRRGKC